LHPQSPATQRRGLFLHYECIPLDEADYLLVSEFHAHVQPVA
jgi:hypothetical protein